MNFSRVMAEKRALMIPLILGIAANVLLYALVVFPLGRQVKGAEAEQRVEREELVRARQDFQLAKATVTGKQEADSALKKFYKDVLPIDQGAARKLTFTRLLELARQANVRLEHGSNQVKHEKNSSLSKLTTTYTLTGEYRDVRKFIYSLETTPEFIVLENVALMAATGEQQQAAHALSMTLEIATYFRSGEAADESD